MKPGYRFVDREAFLAWRYMNYLETKKTIKENGMEDVTILTDLDMIEPESGRLLKDCMLCDRCNDWIEEPVFVMLHDNMVFHEACVREEAGIQSQESNVIPLQRN